MGQFYTLLERAVGRLQPNTAGARQEIYARARSAVVQELRAIDPPLAPAERARREQELEEAIQRVEREYGAAGPASRSATVAVPARAADPDADRTGPAVPQKPGRSSPPPDLREPRRSITSRLLLVALLALVLAGASYAAYTYRAELEDFFASLTGGSASPDTTVAAAGTGAAIEEPAPVAVAAVVPTQSFLYEEVGGGTAPAVPGTVEWVLVEGPDGTRIEIRIDIPSRGLQVVLDMRKAPDAATDVSHTVDIVGTVPAGDAARALQSIAQFAGKTTEDAIGTTIVAQSSTVAPGHLRLDLAAGSERQNLLQLRRDWFDLGIVYANGDRALLTFNKGSEGHEVMRQALAAWQD